MLPPATRCATACNLVCYRCNHLCVCCSLAEAAAREAAAAAAAVAAVAEVAEVAEAAEVVEEAGAEAVEVGAPWASAKWAGANSNSTSATYGDANASCEGGTVAASAAAVERPPSEWARVNLDVDLGAALHDDLSAATHAMNAAGAPPLLPAPPPAAAADDSPMTPDDPR